MTAEGDLDAVYTRLFPKLVGLIALYCGDRSVAEEVAQEALSRLWERTSTTALRSPEAWTYRVAMNLATSRLRRRGIERRAQRFAFVEGSTEPHETSADVLAVRDAVAALPARQREVILLRYYADLSVEETAAVMRCAQGTVKAHTHKALAALARNGLDDG